MEKNAEPPVVVQAAAKELHAAIDRVVAAFGKPEPFGKQCDEFTTVAKRFAASILAERIRQSFLEQVDPKWNFPLESPDEKIAHTKEIRAWLAPWNLAFECETIDGRRAPHQLYAVKTGNGRQGTFTLSEYGGSSNLRNRMSSWQDSIRAVVTNPVLVDVTDLTRHHESRDR